MKYDKVKAGTVFKSYLNSKDAYICIRRHSKTHLIIDILSLLDGRVRMNYDCRGSLLRISDTVLTPLEMAIYGVVEE